MWIKIHIFNKPSPRNNVNISVGKSHKEKDKPFRDKDDQNKSKGTLIRGKESL